MQAQGPPGLTLAAAQGCTCVSLLTLVDHLNGTASCELFLQHLTHLNVIIPATIAGTVGLAVLAALLLVYRRLRHELSAKAQGPPGDAPGLQARDLPAYL